MRPWIVVAAAGLGRRFNGDQSNAKPKQYQLLAGKPVIQHTLERLLSFEPAGIVVALHGDDNYWAEFGLADNQLIHTIVGGEERADSVRAGLAFVAERAAVDDWVMVHDVARPCVTVQDIEQLYRSLSHDAVGGLLACPVSDTIKRVGRGNHVIATEDRTTLWSAMTPQMFRVGQLIRAIDAAHQNGHVATDEAAAIEFAGFSPRVVAGRRDNIKITRPEDMSVAEAIITFQRQENK